MKSLLLALVPAVLAQDAPPKFIDYEKTPFAIGAACQRAVDKAENGFDAVAALAPEARTFDNTVAAFDRATWDMLDATLGLVNLKDVSTDKSVREAGHQCSSMLEDFDVELYSREDLFKALSEYAARNEPLEGEDAKLLEKTLLDYKRNGFGLPAEVRQQVKELKKRLVQLELDYKQRLNEEKAFLAVTPEELAGLPEDFVAAREKLEDGRLKVTLDYPDYTPFMRNARSADARRRLEELFNRRGSTENVKRLEEALALRQRVASLLGYPNHAAYVLEDRMAKDPSAVAAFLQELSGRLKEQARSERDVLVAMKNEEEGAASDGVLRAWDFNYYDNKLKKTKYELDEEAVREYFPFESVKAGMFRIYQTLLGVRFVEVKGAPVWHPDVQLFRVEDAADGRVIGWFYMDLFPREGKYKHAHASTLFQGRRLRDGSYRQPVRMIVANFNKPSADRPSLLKHDEVETLFHEFGHIMHGVLTKARYGRFAGTSVSWDFVEAPSQMLENWIWDKNILKAISVHYKDKTKKLPSELIAKMIAAKNMNAGLRYSRQVFLASIDQRFHTLDGLEPGAPLPFDATELWGRLQEEIALLPMTPGTHPPSAFGHLMGGYDSGYYGYLWSEVFAADMYSRFEKEGVLNPALGKRYRELILEPGRGKDEAAQLREFLGREPDQGAFLKSIGLEDRNRKG